MSEQNPLRNFTLLGRLWIIACILIGTLVFVAYTLEFLPGLPAGRYPIGLFLVPVALAMFAIYGAGYAILRLCGLRLRHDRTIDSRQHR